MSAKDYGLNQIGNLMAGRGERPFALTEEWRSYLILIPKTFLACPKLYYLLKLF